MRIALLHYSAPPVVGGVESVLAQQARLMAEAGHVAHVIAARGEQWAHDIPFVPVSLIDSLHPEALAVKAELDAGVVSLRFEQLRDQIQGSLRPLLWAMDVVVAHNVCSLHKNLALTAALHTLSRAPGAPGFILWHHDLAWGTPRYRAELHEGYPWDLLRLASAWPGVQHVVVSEPRRLELAELMRIPVETIRVIPNGIDRGTFFKLEPQTRGLWEAMDLEQAEPLLLLPVRLTPRKNIELALRVLAELRRAPSAGAALVVTGPEGAHNPANAEYKRRLLALRGELGLGGAAHFAAEHVSGYLPDAVVADFFRLADALFLPSREEGFGIPLVEAAVSRMPVFCADIAPLRELGQGEVTYFSPEADPAQVADAIVARLRNDSAYQFASRARRDFTWERLYQAHIAPLLSSAASRTRGEA